MRNRLMVITVALSAAALGGCIGRQEMLVRHETTCGAYGFVPGSQGFANCLLQLEMSDYGYSHHGRRGNFWPGMMPSPTPDPK